MSEAHTRMVRDKFLCGTSFSFGPSEKAQLTYIESFWPRRKLPLKRRKQDLNLLIYKDRKTPKR